MPRSEINAGLKSCRAEARDVPAIVAIYNQGIAARIATFETSLGVGRAALQALMTSGFWKLVSRVFPENAASRELCRALGFREVGIYRRHAKLEGKWRDVVIVERLLGDAAA